MYDYILTYADNQVETYVVGAWQAFITHGTPWVFTMMGLYFAVLGILYLFQKLQMTLENLMQQVFKVILIAAFVLSMDAMVQIIYNTATAVPEAIANILYQTLGENEDSLNQSMNNIWKNGAVISEKTWSLGGLSNIAAFFLSILISMALWAVMTMTLLQLLRAKLGLAVTLALAPFAIVMLMFEKTQWVFEGWMRLTATFAIIPIFVYGMLIFIAGLLSNTSNDLFDSVSSGNIVNLGQISAYIVVNLLGAFLVSQSYKWASSITSGSALSASGSGQKVRQSMREQGKELYIKAKTFGSSTIG